MRILLTAVAFFWMAGQALAQEVPLVQTQFLNYEIRVYPSPVTGKAGLLKIYQNNTIVFEEEGNEYSLENPDLNFPNLGDDITGDGQPDLVLAHWSGGAHCCIDVYVFTIGGTFALIDKIDGGHGMGGFKDLNKDGVMEIVALDWNFAYWNASFASSPAPKVVLGYKEGGYLLNRDLMKKPIEEIKPFTPLDEATRKDDCASGNAWKKDGKCVTPDVWAYMLDLIYAGQTEAAWKFLDDQKSPDGVTKAAFLQEFKQQLAKSPYKVWPVRQ